mmetsp:Transcript_42325/g.99297  ORF Transcript_42325/g.99297 Transcript_42325/m.99297 type:complete len:239 (-) Transcript_42325:1742-2458(-)
MVSDSSNDLIVAEGLQIGKEPFEFVGVPLVLLVLSVAVLAFVVGGGQVFVVGVVPFFVSVAEFGVALDVPFSFSHDAVFDRRQAVADHFFPKVRIVDVDLLVRFVGVFVVDFEGGFGEGSAGGGGLAPGIFVGEHLCPGQNGIDVGVDEFGGGFFSVAVLGFVEHVVGSVSQEPFEIFFGEFDGFVVFVVDPVEHGLIQSHFEGGHVKHVELVGFSGDESVDFDVFGLSDTVTAGHGL